jgi:hypothetical protein
MKVIASVEEASVIHLILQHLRATVEYAGSSLARGPPGGEMAGMEDTF